MAHDIAVSVVVPVCDSARYLPKCLDSIAAQTLRDIELICVDDASSDESPAILEGYAHRMASMRVLTSASRGGVSHARNMGMQAARGRYIAFVDSDDWVLPTHFERLLAVAESCASDLTITGFSEYYGGVDASRPRELFSCEELWGVPFRLADLPCPYTDLLTPAVWRVLLRRDYWKRTGAGFREGLATSEDMLFIYELFGWDPCIAVNPERSYRYRRDTAGTLTRHRESLDGFKALAGIETSWRERGVGERFAMHFSNLVLNVAEYEMKGAVDSASFRAGYECFMREWEGSGRFDPALLKGRHADFYRRILSSTPDELLFQLYADVRGVEERQRVEIASERRRAAAAEFDADAVRRSHAFRVGRKLMFIPSRIKRIFEGRME